MIEKFNRMDNSKKIPIVLSIAVGLIIFVIVYSLYNGNSNVYSDIKEDSNKGFVYTINSEENGSYYIEVPYVNIAGSVGKEINEDIDSYALDFVDNDKVIFSYDYNINGKVLSLVLKVVDYSTENVPKVYFKTYNINLDSPHLLSEEELLSIYNVNSEKVEGIIAKKFNKWYSDLLEKGYLHEEECDYECFLEYRDVEDYLDDVVYYIDQGKLVAFKPFVFHSIFGEEKYFKESDFKFIISE